MISHYHRLQLWVGSLFLTSKQCALANLTALGRTQCALANLSALGRTQWMTVGRGSCGLEWSSSDPTPSKSSSRPLSQSVGMDGEQTCKVGIQDLVNNTLEPLPYRGNEGVFWHAGLQTEVQLDQLVQELGE